jgi:hypothetical protein
MTTTRYELPWPIIMADVEQAIADCNAGKRFIRIKHVADYIAHSKKNYRHLSGESQGVLVARIGHALKRMNWERFTSSGSRSAVYINPGVEA